METARDRQRKKAAAVQAAQTQSTTQKEAQQSGARDRQRAKAAQVAQQGVKRTKANTKFAEAADRMERVGINTANERSMLDRKLERSRAERAAAHAASQKTLQQDAARVGAQAQRDFAAARETAGGAYSDALNRLLAQHERNSEVAKNLATDDWQKRHGGIAPEDAARTKAIRQAAEIARGDAQGYFRPDSAVSREDLAVMLARFLQVQGRALPAGAEPDCTDASAIAAYARDSVAALGKIGAITGRSTGAFSPKDSATRAECAKILYKSLLYLEEN